MKKCKSCQKEIDDKATKCPYCQTDLRSWFKRHPILTLFIGLTILPLFLAPFLGSDKSEKPEPKIQTTTTSQKVEKKSKSVAQVLENLSNTLNQANQKVGFQFYKNVRIEEHGGYWAIFTISDDWYNLEPYVQERLVKIAVNYYREVEGGLNYSAEISLEDQAGKEVAWGSYVSGKVNTEILK